MHAWLKTIPPGPCSARYPGKSEFSGLPYYNRRLNQGGDGWLNARRFHYRGDGLHGEQAGGGAIAARTSRACAGQTGCRIEASCRLRSGEWRCAACGNVRCADIAGGYVCAFGRRGASQSEEAAEFQSIDLKSCQEAVRAATKAGVRHFVYLSVARPALVMKEYQAARAEGERLIREQRPGGNVRPSVVRARPRAQVAATVSPHVRIGAIGPGNPDAPNGWRW